ncbi:hypothetical protein IFR05_006512 [Cadophora sp. M221]|nr:hypothetical protein IFR05_006512 [Cadophora sp. M221]
MSSSDLLTALEGERQRLLRAKGDSRVHAKITAAYQTTIAEKHATYRKKSRRYDRWVERQARRLEVKLEKKRKQMERNKQNMDMRKNAHYAEVEHLHAKIDKTETERAAEQHV